MVGFFWIAWMLQHPAAVCFDQQKRRLTMRVTESLFVASFLALAMTVPVQAQSPTQGDYYAPGPATTVHGSAADLKKNAQGDYYVGDKMILNGKRSAAIKKCTDGIRFDSDRYVACMAKQGEAP
jgi:hypothetical protein